VIARVVLVVLFLGLTGAAFALSRAGVWGESPGGVPSLRVGSPGGGYGSTGRIK
jgi:hypothetical protein